MFDYQAPEALLHERIILITGASEGIGRAMAKSFAKHGATTLLHGRNIERLETLYDEILAEGGPQPAICPLDLKSQNFDDYITLQQSIGETFGRLDGLVHNAGSLSRLSPIANTTTHDWLDDMQVNANAPFMLSKAMLPLLHESDSGSIVFCSSSVGRKARAHWGSYSASKYALEALMLTLADELENTSHIRCNSVNPGATRTAMRQKAYPGEDRFTLPEPASILPIFLYLMGKDSQGINGQQLNAQMGKASELTKA